MPPGGRKWHFSIRFDSEGNQLSDLAVARVLSVGKHELLNIEIQTFA